MSRSDPSVLNASSDELGVGRYQDRGQRSKPFPHCHPLARGSRLPLAHLPPRGHIPNPMVYNSFNIAHCTSTCTKSRLLLTLCIKWSTRPVESTGWEEGVPPFSIKPGWTTDVGVRSGVRLCCGGHDSRCRGGGGVLLNRPSYAWKSSNANKVECKMDTPTSDDLMVVVGKGGGGGGVLVIARPDTLDPGTGSNGEEAPATTKPLVANAINHRPTENAGMGPVSHLLPAAMAKTWEMAGPPPSSMHTTTAMRMTLSSTLTQFCCSPCCPMRMYPPSSRHSRCSL